MKFNVVKILIATAISVLLAYACFAISDYQSVQWVVAVGSFIATLPPVLFAIGIKPKAERTAVILIVFSWVVLLLEVVMNGIFAFFEFNIAAYVIVNAILLLLYALIYSSVYQKKM